MGSATLINSRKKTSRLSAGEKRYERLQQVVETAQHSDRVRFAKLTKLQKATLLVVEGMYGDYSYYDVSTFENFVSAIVSIFDELDEQGDYQEYGFLDDAGKPEATVAEFKRYDRARKGSLSDILKMVFSETTTSTLKFIVPQSAHS